MFTVRIGENDYVAYEKTTIQEWFDENRMGAEHMLFNHLNGMWVTVGEFLGLESDTEKPESAENALFESSKGKSAFLTDTDESAADVKPHTDAVPFREQDTKPIEQVPKRAPARRSPENRYEKILMRFAKKAAILRFFANLILFLCILWGCGTAASLYGPDFLQILGIFLVAGLVGGIAFLILRGIASVLDLLGIVLNELNDKSKS